jgi:uncharacterized integral membrane protein
MRIINWLVRAAAFIALFALALNNLHEVELKGFFGSAWRAPMILVVLGALALGCLCGALAMLPSWWRQRQRTRGDAPPTSVLTPSDLEPVLPGSTPTHPPRDGL